MEDNKTNTTRNDMNSFFDEDANSGFKFKDLVFLVWRNLPWFLVCAVICGMAAFYRVRSQERIYASQATMMIKTTSSAGSESLRGSFALNNIASSGLVVSNITNEIIVLKSQKNMENMVRELNLNTLYSYQTKIAKRNRDLYKDSPVDVSFPDMDSEAGISFSLKIVDKGHVILDNLGEYIPSMKVRVNDTVATPFGKLVVTPSWRYDDFMGVTIVVNHIPLSSMASAYRSRIKVTRDDERNTILRLSLRDTSPPARLRCTEHLDAGV